MVSAYFNMSKNHSMKSACGHFFRVQKACTCVRHAVDGKTPEHPQEVACAQAAIDGRKLVDPLPHIRDEISRVASRPPPDDSSFAI